MPPSAPGAQASLAAVARELVCLEGRLLTLENDQRESIERAAPDQRDSARNLVHYIALRQHDLRELQLQLSALGLSSLGRSESCVMGSVHAASERAHESLALRGNEDAQGELIRLEKQRPTVSSETAKAYLHQHTRDMLGPRPDDRHIYIMVTAPSAKEADRTWMVTMLRAGMNVLRINCAHEGEREWTQVIEALRDARNEAGKECRVLMDLAGPKIRTGPVAGGRRVVTFKPVKDEIGQVTAPARVVIRRTSAPHCAFNGLTLLMGDNGFATTRSGDELRFRDSRGKKRRLEIRSVGPSELVAFSTARAYLFDPVHARHYRGGEYEGNLTIRVGGEAPGVIDVQMGDALVLTRRTVAGKPPRRNRNGHVEEPGVIGCTLAAALEELKVGHRVLFDDGRIHTIVEQAQKGGDFLLRVTRTQRKIAKLRAEKGINLPDTRVTIPSLTEDDLRAIAFVAQHADAIGLSFVRTPADVRMLHVELDRLGRSRIGVVLKIETRAGFENLPRLLLEGLRRPPLAIMIARGDLAVEIGFERLAEVQEEILWLCEAGHVPAIWATQVLDTLARTGVPSRAEVTDAAASVAAECVMLNKGPFVDQAVTVLSDILRRMEQHHYKKRSLFRKLQVSTLAEPALPATATGIELLTEQPSPLPASSSEPVTTVTV